MAENGTGQEKNWLLYLDY